MRKRNAVSAAALASIGLGGIATAAVDAQHHTSSPPAGARSLAVRGPTRGRPRVVTVYVDDPPTSAVTGPPAGAPGGTVPSHGARSAPTSTATLPAPTAGGGSPSTTSPRAPTSGASHVPAPPTTVAAHPGTTTTTPVTTAIPPVTTTTAASSVRDDGGHDGSGGDD